MINIIISWMMRVSSIILAFISIPLMIGDLGKEVYGQFSIIQGLLPWFLLIDLGVGTKTQNIIGGGNQRKGIALFFSSLIFTLCSSLFLFFFFIIFGDLLLGKLLNISGDVMHEFILCIGIFCLWGVLEPIIKVYYALFESVKVNLYVLLANLFSLIMLLLYRDIGLQGYVLIIFAPQIAVRFLLLAMLFVVNKISLSQSILSEAVVLIKQSRGFWFFSIMANLVLYFDYISISFVLKPSEYADYTVLSKIYASGFTLYSSVIAIYWSFYTKNIKEKKIIEVISVSRRIILLFFLAVVVSSFMLFLIYPFVNDFLSNKSKLEINPILILLFCVYYCIRIWSDLHAMILQSSDNIEVLLKLVPFQMLISVLLQIFLGYHLGALGVVLGMIFSFLFTSSIILPVEVYKKFRFRIL